MRAIVYTENGGPEVLTYVEDRATPEPEAGEVLVRVHVSGVNPTDWKSRSGATARLADGQVQVPNQDGAGVIEAVGDGVPAELVGRRVWLWGTATGRTGGSAQEYVALAADHAIPMGEDVSFDVGAALGVPALTAHRALTVHEDAPARLAPGALDGWTVLVQGGAGAVGHAAIELARWSGATVIATISSDEKAALATAAGAHHVVNYRTEDAEAEIRRLAPDGVHTVVEVALPVNVDLDAAVTANNATVAFYADSGGSEATIPVRPSMIKNLTWHGLLLYTVPAVAAAEAVAGVSAALADGALRVGEDAGLPLTRFPLAQTADAHVAVEQGAVGKVLIDV